MKMEIPVLAPRKGRVAEFRVNEGDSAAEELVPDQAMDNGPGSPPTGLRRQAT